MPVPRHGSPSDKRSAEIGHLIDKGYPVKRAAAAAYNMYGEEAEYEDVYAEDGGASAASPRFDEDEVKRLLELCRENRRRRGL